ncbi:SPOR domain-containing protein [Sinimarinibacterium sp. CAU 1509]|uniref:SPOR domain-containing protein n=1 Tax=Sinimarinibacterium sp. CAU 1509 TaxID=2562283 RepID=UPI0010ABFAA6|nr:SPOR domain-containing protein [Sinimarinibacterium sp. CAU 1509]TJY59796.1 SPOR domain-containing protein [Sinimarinibacterium sp. CAU 1509]
MMGFAKCGRGVLALAVFAGMAGSAHAASGTRLDIVRLSGDVLREQASVARALEVPEPLNSGDRVHTGRASHVALQVGRTGLATLGPDSTLRIHSLFPPEPPTRMQLSKLVLEQGSINIDTRPKDASQPPSDVRLNAGVLKLRIFGAAAWIRHDDAADEVCLLHGAIEVGTPDGPQRLDEPGSCLLASGAGTALSSARQVGSLAARLQLTAFPNDDALRDEILQRAQAQARPQPAFPVAPQTEPAPPKPAAAAPVAAATPNTAAAAQTGGGWGIVLGSVSDAQRAAAEAERFSAEGLQARVVPAKLGGGTTYRIVSGHFATKDEADAMLPAVRARRDLQGAWIVATP